MNLTDSQITNDYGLPTEFLGSSVDFRYQKTGGVYVCPDCGKLIGTAKQLRGTIVPQERPTCSSCGVLGVLKFAQIITKPGSTTKVILTMKDGTKFVGKTTLNKADKFDKRLARAYAMANLVKKIKAQLSVAA